MLVNISQAAKHLDLTVRTVREYCYKNIIPHYKIGPLKSDFIIDTRLLRFKLDELDEWIKRFRIPSIYEKENKHLRKKLPWEK